MIYSRLHLHMSAWVFFYLNVYTRWPIYLIQGFDTAYQSSSKFPWPKTDACFFQIPRSFSWFFFRSSYGATSLINGFTCTTRPQRPNSCWWLDCMSCGPFHIAWLFRPGQSGLGSWAGLVKILTVEKLNTSGTGRVSWTHQK